TAAPDGTVLTAKLLSLNPGRYVAAHVGRNVPVGAANHASAVATKNAHGGVLMESKAKLLGHPIHPMLIVFPLGLLATAMAFDIVGLASGASEWFRISFWMIAAGIIGGLLSAVFGLVDWIAIPAGTRAKTIGLWHGGGNVI